MEKYEVLSFRCGSQPRIVCGVASHPGAVYREIATCESHEYAHLICDALNRQSVLTEKSEERIAMFISMRDKLIEVREEKALQKPVPIFTFMLGGRQPMYDILTDLINRLGAEIDTIRRTNA